MIAENQENEPESLGDYGGGISENRSNQQTQRFIRRAIRERWLIPEQFREALINRQIKEAIDPNNTAREVKGAFLAVLAAEKQNMEAERLALEVEGIIGSSRDPLLMPTQVTANGPVQVNISLPDNGRGPVIEHRNLTNGDGNGAVH